MSNPLPAPPAPAPPAPPPGPLTAEITYANQIKRSLTNEAIHFVRSKLPRDQEFDEACVAFFAVLLNEGKKSSEDVLNFLYGPLTLEAFEYVFRHRDLDRVCDVWVQAMFDAAGGRQRNLLSFTHISEAIALGRVNDFVRDVIGNPNRYNNTNRDIHEQFRNAFHTREATDDVEGMGGILSSTICERRNTRARQAAEAVEAAARANAVVID